MTTKNTTLSTEPMSRSDQMELLEYLPDSAVEFESANLSPGHLGEPTTAIAIISVTMVVISSLCAWVATKGHGVSLTLGLKGPGVAANLSLILNEDSTPATIREDLEKQGVEITE